MYQKFIITQEGVLRFGTVYLHRELLLSGEQCGYGGGLWRIDHDRRAIVLYGRSFDFGLPRFEYVRRIDWTGAGGTPYPLLYMPKWPDETFTEPVFARHDEAHTRVLVTGSHGFLGSRVAWYLHEKCGHTIYAPSHQEMDITEMDSCLRAVATFRPAYVVHCAAISSTTYCQAHPEASREVNIEGTCHVVRAASLHHARCIYMSSDQVYQHEQNEWTQTFREEETDLAHHTPRSVYGRDKLEMERKAQETDASAIGLRLTWMYDRKESGTMPDRPARFRVNHGLMANLEKAQQEGSPIRACTRERRGVTDVWEVVKSIALLIRHPHVPGGIYNCGSPCTQTTYELYLQLAAEWGIDLSLILPDDTWSRSLAMDTTKFAHLRL